MTDGAIGKREEPNLRHVVLNLGPETDRARIVPILTTKHTLEYCLDFAERTYQLGFRSMVVLGGDKSDGIPRCVPHANLLRFFFQAEDGIRDKLVTGVQTCALPI